MAATLPLLSISQLAIIHYKLTSWETFRHIHILLVTCKVIDQHTSPLIMSRQLKKSVATSTQVIEEILKNDANETELLHLCNGFLRTKTEGLMRFHSRACWSVPFMWLRDKAIATPVEYVPYYLSFLLFFTLVMSIVSSQLFASCFCPIFFLILSWVVTVHLVDFCGVSEGEVSWDG
jgi:hypothetical protein